MKAPSPSPSHSLSPSSSPSPLLSQADIIAFIGICLIVASIFLAERRIERTKGHKLINHAIYFSVGILMILFLPTEIKADIFSPVGVMVVGTALPVYESIRAVVTIDSDDDTVWLQYWLTQAALSFSTEFIDDFEPSAFKTHWHEFEFFFMLWLALPMTDGAHLVYEYITDPYLAPIIQPYVSKFDTWLNKVVLMFVNASHMWLIWAAFEFLDPSWKRAVWIGIGVIYPLGASLIAVTTPEGSDDTFWLTYWSCFNIQFLIIDFLEDFFGQIYGFYTVSIIFTVYLMLPLFNGAEKVFRHILVPIAGLHEMLIKRDAYQIKMETLAKIPEERRALVLKEIADKFMEEETVKGKTTNYQAISQVV